MKETRVGKLKCNSFYVIIMINVIILVQMHESHERLVSPIRSSNCYLLLSIDSNGPSDDNDNYDTI